MKPRRKVIKLEGRERPVHMLECGHVLPVTRYPLLPKVRTCYLCDDERQRKGYKHKIIQAARQVNRFANKLHRLQKEAR